MKRIVTAALSLSLLATGAAFAAPQQGPHAGHTAAHPRAQQPAVPSKQHAQQAAPAPAHSARPQPAPRASHAPHAQQQAQHAPRKGERLAQGHRGTQVNEYKRHGLRKPGRGQEWRKVDQRYLLIAVATGIIADIVSAR